jgi:hypothetical protein
MTVRHPTLTPASARLLVDGRRATMATSIMVDGRADTAAHLAHLIEPAHRIAHVQPVSKIDARGRIVAAGPSGDDYPHVDQETLRSSCSDTVAA